MMMFEKKSAKDRLLAYFKQEKVLKSSDVIRWGCREGYSNRSARNARQLANEGKIRRLTKKETTERFGRIAEAVWVYEKTT